MGESSNDNKKKQEFINKLPEWFKLTLTLFGLIYPDKDIRNKAKGFWNRNYNFLGKLSGDEK